MSKSVKIKTNIKLVLASSFFSVFLFGILSFHMFNRFIEESRTKFDFPTFLVLSFFIILLFSTSLFVLNFFSNIEINEDEIEQPGTGTAPNLRFAIYPNPSNGQFIIEVEGYLFGTT